MTTAPEVVTATAREGKFNKNAARRVRVQGKIPGVIYGAQRAGAGIGARSQADATNSLVRVRPQHDF